MRASIVLLLLHVGCVRWTYDTTTHFGGTVSVRLTPDDAGVALAGEGDGAPANQDLGACTSYLSLQEPRRRDVESNQTLSICLPDQALDSETCPPVAEVSLVVSSGGGHLWLESEHEAIDGAFAVPRAFAWVPEGSASFPVVLDAPCLGGPADHMLDIDWRFDRSETVKEGRYNPFEPTPIGDV